MSDNLIEQELHLEQVRADIARKTQEILFEPRKYRVQLFAAFATAFIAGAAVFAAGATWFQPRSIQVQPIIIQLPVKVQP